MVLDDRLKLELVADSDQIVTPTGISVEAGTGRVFVIENHTHHRPKEYQGPPTDRIKIFTPQPDGKLKITGIFHDGFSDGMNLRFGPDGWLYMMQRSRFSRLRDADGDGKADKIEILIDCKTSAVYPHNGMSGFDFDPKGGIYFGIGENAGEAYTLTGSDGSTYSAHRGEGGSYFHCNADGSKLTRFATGIWNPFGLCVTSTGDIFATDNDPGSCPPPRLLHVLEGGDYGYRHHYGGGGTSPLITWTGQFIGTLPMVQAIGEGPSGILPGERTSLPADYNNALLVASWSDHQIERLDLSERGASFAAKRSAIVQGNAEFRPANFAVAADGSIYFTDWVSASYPVHGRGRIWHLKSKLPPPKPDPIPAYVLDISQRKADQLRAMRLPQDSAPLLAALDDADPYLVNAAITGLSRSPGILDLDTSTLPQRQKIGVLVAMQRAAPGDKADAKLIRRFITDPDPEARFYALRWISDENRVDMKGDIEALLRRSDLDARTFIGSLHALERLEGKFPAGNPSPLAFLDRLNDPATAPAIRALCLRLMPAGYAKLKTTDLRNFAVSPDAGLRIEAIRTLSQRADAASIQALAWIAAEEKRSVEERAEAIVGLGSHADQHVPLLHQLKSSKEPTLAAEAARALVGIDADPSRQPIALAPTDVAGWEKLVAAGKGDPESGRRIFFSARVATCSRCHIVDGRGIRVGPELTTIARRADLKFLLQSMLDPSAELAPQYIARIVTTTDGKQITGIPLRLASTETYLGLDGKEIPIKLENIAHRQDLTASLMPPGLPYTLTAQELRDLIAFLLSLR